MDLKALCRQVVAGCNTLLYRTPVGQDISMRQLELSVLVPATRVLDEHYKTLRKEASRAQSVKGTAPTSKENLYEEMKRGLGGLLLASYMGNADLQEDLLMELADIYGEMSGSTPE